MSAPLVGSGAVRVKIGTLFLTAAMMLPALALGDGLASLCGLKVFSFHDVWEGFWGALNLAFVLALTRSEQ
jgi:hypothetical protein